MTPEIDYDVAVDDWRKAIAMRHQQEARVWSVEETLEANQVAKELRGDRFIENLGNLICELESLMLQKHQDYGPKNIADAPGGAINGLRVRMHDKLARINNLHESGVAPNNESLEDSFKDLANYGIIGLMVLRGHWPGTDDGR